MASLVLNGGTGSDSLVGDVDNDTLNGGARWDTLVGGDGDDVLDGGLDNDQMYGGDGNDTYYVDHVGDRVHENINEGFDTVVASISWDLNAHVEGLFLTGTADLAGRGNSLNNVMVGNAGANTLWGGNGNDSFGGGAGADRLFGEDGNDVMDGGVDADQMYGGRGNDVYYVDNTADQVVESADEGFDTVLTYISLKAAANVEAVFLLGKDDNSAYGNALANRLTGNAGNNTLSGADGQDTLQGMGGDDKLVGGLGADVLEGGNGNDFLAGNEGSDLLEGGEGDDGLNGGERWDSLFGGEGNDILDGGADNDQMTGGTGNDTYVVDHIGDRVYENLDEGIDTVKSSIDFALTPHVEHLYLTGTADISGTGNGLNNNINGNAGNNALSGGLGKDTLVGWGGNDLLDGGNDHDSLSGGDGNDTLIGGHGQDRMLGGTGVDDFVFSSTAVNGHDHVLDFHHAIDRLVFTGADYGFATGHVLTAAEFTVGTAAVGAGAQFIWNDATDRLYWDADGSGAGAAFEIAIVSGTTVTASDLYFS